MIYALPEIRPTALTRVYAVDIYTPYSPFVSVKYAKQRTVDVVKSGRPMVKVARRVT